MDSVGAKRRKSLHVFEKCRQRGKHMWGRLEVVAKKINESVFLDSSQEKLTQPIISR